MRYKIIADSSCELEESFLGDERFASVALGIDVGEDHIIDDDTFELIPFLKKIAAYPECPKSACPSPGAYFEEYEKAAKAGAEHIYVVTLSSKLSGSYNSAMAGKDIYEEEYEDTKVRIHVVDSRTASCGELQIVEKLVELEERGISFDEIVERIEVFRDGVITYFVLDNLDTFKKTGRLSGIKALAVDTLNLRPILYGAQGSIAQKDIARGNKKALRKMVDYCVSELSEKKDDVVLMITHCNAPERAAEVKRMFIERMEFARVVVLEMHGLSSMYANDGGIIVTG